MGSTKLPNYQGMFLRGFGKQSHSQNNGHIIGITSTTHESGGLGAVQGDAMRHIYGTFNSSGTGRWPYYNTSSGALYHSYGGLEGSTTKSDNVAMNIDTARIVPTAIENRPVNVAVNYLIKAY